MSHSHLKRMVVPTTWPGILRKENKYVIRPTPGTHSIEMAMPLALWMRHLGHAKTQREIRQILLHSDVRVDGRRVKDPGFPVGYMDSLAFADSKQAYRVHLDKMGRLALTPIKQDAAGKKPCRVTAKRVIRGCVFQVSFQDGRTVRLEKAKATMAIGDTVILAVPGNAIGTHLPLKKGAHITLIGGKHVGDSGTLVEISGGKIVYDSETAKEKIETLKQYAYVLPKDEKA